MLGRGNVVANTNTDEYQILKKNVKILEHLTSEETLGSFVDESF